MLVLQRLMQNAGRAVLLSHWTGDPAERARAAIPGVAIHADVIAGFPTEDAAMHAANLSIIAELAIVHGHVFPYSARPGTPAARMPQVERETLLKDKASLAEVLVDFHDRPLCGADQIERAAELKSASRDWISWDLTPRQFCDLELLLNGGFSPLTGS